MSLPCRVVLFEPRDARNVGMVARACANFGVTDLVVVHAEKLAAASARADRSEMKAHQLGFEKKAVLVPSSIQNGDADISATLPFPSLVEVVATAEPLARKTLEVRSCRFDVSAWKGCDRLATGDGMVVLQNSRLCCSLAAAVSGARRAVAFSGRDGDNFRRPTVALRELAAEVAGQGNAIVGASVQEGGNCCRPSSQPTALVFGSEDVGLPTDALLQCDGVCQLQTAGCMSLNLSHAVAVTLARLLEERLSPTASLRSHARSRSRSPKGCRIECADTEISGSSAAATVVNSVPTPHERGEAPGLWTARWAEHCRSNLEVLGYPTSPEQWSSKGRKKCKFAYRLFKIVANCTRTLQRAQPTVEEAESWTKLVGALSSRPSSERSVNDPPAFTGEKSVEDKGSEIDKTASDKDC
eukprot:TRINITY_DN29082_c0_g1_i1.p1 TRINITY_DN29082_c0_g1~~TRINITY_DN29082_c0_g1_i1.p1  ORF type:complete len:413 (+),score=71.42 TRINITY_DN29082_c0_g1_i1:76-1314(+)